MKRADSQIGFLKFVVRPTYCLLGEIVPRVKEDVIPIIDQNIKYWTREKARMSVARGTGFGFTGVFKTANRSALKSSIEAADCDESSDSDDHFVNNSSEVEIVRDSVHSDVSCIGSQGADSDEERGDGEAKVRAGNNSEEKIVGDKADRDAIGDLPVKAKVKATIIAQKRSSIASITEETGSEDESDVASAKSITEFTDSSR